MKRRILTIGVVMGFLAGAGCTRGDQDRAREQTRETQEKAQRQLQDARDKLRENLKHADQQTREDLDKARDQLNHALDQSKHDADKARDRLREREKDRDTGDTHQ